LVEVWLDWRGSAIDPLYCGICQGKPNNRPLGTAMVKLIIKEAAAAGALLLKKSKLSVAARYAWARHRTCSVPGSIALPSCVRVVGYP
jgi:hypothetical protein